MTDHPPFPPALRGYARDEVDAHVARTQAALAEAQQRAAAAEQRAVAAEQRAEAAQRDAAEVQGQLAQFRDELVAERARVREIAERVDQAPAPRPAGGSGPLRPLTLPGAVPGGGPKTLAPPLLIPPPLVPPGPPRRSSGRARLLPLGAGLLAGALLGAGTMAAVDRDPAEVTRVPASAPSPVTSSPLAGQRPTPSASAVRPTPVVSAAPAPAPARAAVAAAPLPRGWSRVVAGDGSWSIGVPPGWRRVGSGSTLRFVSDSGLTTMFVRTAPLTGAVTPAVLKDHERTYAAQHRGYRRVAARLLPFRGTQAGVWDYTYGSGAGTQRVSDLGVILGGRGFQLHVQSRASAWRFVTPLLAGFRSSFAPKG